MSNLRTWSLPPTRRLEADVRILVVPNTTNAAALAATAELSAWLSASGYQPVLARADAEVAELPGFGVSPSEIGEPALVVALGGDGTIIKAVHLLGEVEVPILGVNLGRLGFLTGSTGSDVREAVEAALSGDVRIERRATIDIGLTMEGRSVGHYRALNEVVLGRGASGRVIAVELSVNGRRLARFSGDGIIVATSTGSTAYALSAGGPIISPGIRGLLVVPVAPHTIGSRPIVIESSDVVELTLPDPSRADACLIVDGGLTPCRNRIERVTVKQGDHDVLLAKLGGRDFFDVVADEFYGC